jgi:uncharacterized membrane protein required for colicin V production
MNWLLIVVVVVLAGYAIYGRQRGFIRTVFTLFSTILSLILTLSISPAISKEIQKNDKIMGMVTERVSEVINFSDLGNKITDQVNFIDKLPLPGSLRHTLVENNTADVYKAMGVKSFNDYISNSVSRIIINAAVFVIIMLIVTIALALLCEALNIISKLPLLNGLNKTAGLLAGLIHGIIVVWIGFIIITMFGSTSFGQDIFKLINENTFLSLIYNNNLLLRFITNLGAALF